MRSESLAFGVFRYHFRGIRPIRTHRWPLGPKKGSANVSAARVARWSPVAGVYRSMWKTWPGLSFANRVSECGHLIIFRLAGVVLHDSPSRRRQLCPRRIRGALEQPGGPWHPVPASYSNCKPRRARKTIRRHRPYRFLGQTYCAAIRPRFHSQLYSQTQTVCRVPTAGMAWGIPGWRTSQPSIPPGAHQLAVTFLCALPFAWLRGGLGSSFNRDL